MIGNSGVGKSCIIKRLVLDEFSQAFTSTIGVDFSNFYIRLDDAKLIRMMIWDTAGQERFRAITKAYYRNSQAIIVVYDVN